MCDFILKIVVAVRDDSRQIRDLWHDAHSVLSRSSSSHASPRRLRRRTSTNLPSFMLSVTALPLSARPSTIQATSLRKVLHMVQPPMFHQVVIPNEPFRALSFALWPRTVQVLWMVPAFDVALQIGLAGERMLGR